MDNGSGNDGGFELVGEFRRRFPLFDDVIGRFGENVSAERVPWFFGFILAAAKPGVGACCIVLEKTPGTTAVAAILSGFIRLQDEFPSLVERYARSALERGQRVKVRPSDFVYEYEGVWEEFSNFFRLRLLDENAWRSFPLVDVLRLEPTDRVQPKGTGASKLGAFKRSSLDLLLDITTFGNKSLVQNAVLVQMPRSQFARTAEATILAPRRTRRFAQLSQYLPWGFIGNNGSLKPNDHYQVVGEPLIAVTNFVEDLALAASRVAPGTKTILADGTRQLLRNLQAFDEIADRQRLVILASPDESEELELLRERGCPVWHMSADEVLLGEDSTTKRKRASLVGATLRAAEVRRQCSVETIKCDDEFLQSAALSLEQVAEVTAVQEEAFDVLEALGRLFGILFEFSECCFGVGAATIEDLGVARSQMAQHSRWICPEAVEKLQITFSSLEQAATNGSGNQKAEALLDSLAGGNDRWAVVTRLPRTAERLRLALHARGVAPTVLPVSAIRYDHEFDCVILPTWPNGRRFTRLRNLSVTPDIRVLTYPFENKWVWRHQDRERTRVRSSRLETAKLSSILGIEPRLLEPLGNGKKEADDLQGKKFPIDLPVFQLEERLTRRPIVQHSFAPNGDDSREAQLVQFLGDCYAFITEWAELPLLNDLVHISEGGNAIKINSAAASDLSSGDYVLFRAGGDKEFTRQIAEEILGADNYQRIRNVAERWKSALRHLGESPVIVQRHLADHGLERTAPTIAGWLGNPDRIGPGDHRDIETIAKAAGDEELLSIKDDVIHAITQIRGAHLTAGTHLSRLILNELRGRLYELGDQPTLLSLDFGQAWVVQVEFVEAKRRELPATLVNRLLWTADTVF